MTCRDSAGDQGLRQAWGKAGAVRGSSGKALGKGLRPELVFGPLLRILSVKQRTGFWVPYSG